MLVEVPYICPYTGYMNTSHELDQEAEEPSGRRAVDTLDAADGPASTPVMERRNIRFYIRKDVADRLIKLGVPDDSGSLGYAVNELADMSISLGQAYLPDVSDMATLQTGIHDRLDELNGTTLSLFKLLVELGATGEYKTLLHSFKQLAKEGTPKV